MLADWCESWEDRLRDGRIELRESLTLEQWSEAFNEMAGDRLESNALIEQSVDQLSGERRLAELPIEHALCLRDARQEAELGVDSRDITHAMGNSQNGVRANFITRSSITGFRPPNGDLGRPVETRGGPIDCSDAD